MEIQMPEARTQCPRCDARHSLRTDEKGSYCYACETWGPGKEQRRSARTKKDLEINYISLPDDLQHLMPAEGKQILEKAYINQELICKYDLTYSPTFKRIVIPSVDHDVLLGWQGRSIYPDQLNKYWQFKANKPNYFVSKGFDTLDTCVIVEDAFSAIRVGEIIPTIALTGSIFSYTIINRLRVTQRKSKVLIWTDNDKAGYKAAQQIKDLCGLVGISVIGTIRSDRDPKTYTEKEIENHLREFYEK